ncbi:MAG: hypothetical protein BGO77_02680 [Caedibacter sp. 37-49]|nr:MAG: hypothetical protein BGO77_02680 [Caedibacter sp. 37-49]
MGFISIPLAELQEKRVIVIGYPGDRIDSEEGPVMYEDDGKIIGLGEGEFVHNANTDQGNSGGAFLFDEIITISGEPATVVRKPIIGVHVRGTDFIRSKGNHATLINRHHDIIWDILRGKDLDTWDIFPCFQPKGDQHGKV